METEMRTSTITMGAAALVVMAIGGTWGWSAMRATAEPFAGCTGGQVAGGDIGGPFELVSETGRTVTDADVITEPTLLYFGYTFCPDVCPLDSARNAQAVDMLAERGVDAQAVFVTVDPARDTPEVVGQFTANFSDDMPGLTGSPDQVKAAADAYRVYFDAREEEDPDYYLVDHSTQTYLMFPETGFATFFRNDTPPERVSEVTACFVEQLS